MAALRIGLSLVLASLVAPAQSRDDRWRADVGSLVQELERRHPNAFAYTPRAEFDRIVSDVVADIPFLTDQAVQVRMAEITACLRDGHTLLQLSNLAQLPIVVRRLDDGWWVTAAPESHPEWLGQRVAAVGETPIEDAMRVFKRVISLDNDNQNWLWARAGGGDFQRPDIWHALGVIPSRDSLPLVLESPAGERTDAEVVFGEPFGQVAMDSTGPAPLWTIGQPNYWGRYLESAGTFYVAYNRAAADPSRPMASFANSLFAGFDSLPADRLVIDLRNNVGGDSGVFDPFLDQLGRRRERFENGTKLLCIIGRGTFSAGTEAAVRLKYEHGAVLIGEPSGGNTPSYGAIGTFTLPYSRLQVQHSTKWIPVRGNGGPVVPDVCPGYEARDYFARHDPYLATALAYPEAEWMASDAAVKNAASLRAAPGIAPGSLVSIFGEFDSGAEVLFGETPARVASFGAGKVDAVVPESVPLGEVDVSVGGEVIGHVQVVAANPGLFTVDYFDLRQPGVVLNPDQTPNTGTNRARKLDVIQIFGTGFAADPPVVYLAEEVCKVLSSGPVEGAPGIWQIDVEVPVGSRVRGHTPVYVVSGGVRSNAVTVYIE